ncbi:hypothetical protein AC230_07750 [Streptomyces caatingaensis]|uniref:Uncharacterized protein n=1 Tax=Streptomyces caatingaensis TaxID=1678637 RepID=A0A0K9XHL0_9ACTN|nr:hypothetical protein AC230_07750 [Streptomyces caatingaensis]
MMPGSGCAEHAFARAPDAGPLYRALCVSRPTACMAYSGPQPTVAALHEWIAEHFRDTARSTGEAHEEYERTMGDRVQ